MLLVAGKYRASGRLSGTCECVCAEFWLARQDCRLHYFLDLRLCGVFLYFLRLGGHGITQIQLHV